jgi:hypothetical protein
MTDASEPESGGGRSAGRSKASKPGDQPVDPAGVSHGDLVCCTVLNGCKDVMKDYLARVQFRVLTPSGPSYAAIGLLKETMQAATGRKPGDASKVCRSQHTPA